MKRPGTTPRHSSAGPFTRAALRYRRSIPAMVSLGFVLFVVVVAIFGPLFRPYDPNAQDLSTGSPCPPAAIGSGRTILAVTC
jgi:ABC-type antimicrobial peptide transport system permease subunit